MPRRITPNSSLDTLKREAKHWLKALRDNEPDARARLDRAVPDAPDTPSLRHVQHALARELGFSGWAALKDHLSRAVPDDAVPSAIVRQFLDNACPDHHVRGGRAHVRALHTAMRLLARYPYLARATFAASVVCGDLERVERELATRPGLASQADGTPTATRSGDGGSEDLLTKTLGPTGWTPLLYCCFTRLPLVSSNENALAIARTLLDHGADPNAYFMAGGSRYTPLVGVVGEGEEDRPPHPQRDALVRLLLERGAEPYDIQVVYNIRFHGKVLWFLEVIHERSVALGREADWRDPEWSMLAMGNYGSGARWHLAIAVEHDDLALAEWCLTHGANPNAAPARDARMPQSSLYEDALRRGHCAMAELLVRHGATRVDVSLSDVEAFMTAVFLGPETMHELLAGHPEYLRFPEPLHEAARLDRADIVAALLDAGVSPDVENAEKERALHAAAYANSLNAARLLIDHGAAIDPVESNWGNTPSAAAAYSQATEMIDLLAPYSRDVWELVYAGKLDRLREVLSEEPALARVVSGGHTPLMWLPVEDEARAMDIARLLLGLGADPSLRNQDGMRAADRAERIGMLDLAVLLRAGESAAGAKGSLGA